MGALESGNEGTKERSVWIEFAADSAERFWEETLHLQWPSPQKLRAPVFITWLSRFCRPEISLRKLTGPVDFRLFSPASFCRTCVPPRSLPPLKNAQTINPRYCASLEAPRLGATPFKQFVGYIPMPFRACGLPFLHLCAKKNKRCRRYCVRRTQSTACPPFLKKLLLRKPQVLKTNFPEKIGVVVVKNMSIVTTSKAAPRSQSVSTGSSKKAASECSHSKKSHSPRHPTLAQYPQSGGCAAKNMCGALLVARPQDLAPQQRLIITSLLPGGRPGFL